MVHCLEGTASLLYHILICGELYCHSYSIAHGYACYLRHAFANQKHSCQRMRSVVLRKPRCPASFTNTYSFRWVPLQSVDTLTDGSNSPTSPTPSWAQPCVLAYSEAPIEVQIAISQGPRFHILLHVCSFQEMPRAFELRSSSPRTSYATMHVDSRKPRAACIDASQCLISLRGKGSSPSSREVAHHCYQQPQKSHSKGCGRRVPHHSQLIEVSGCGHRRAPSYLSVGAPMTTACPLWIHPPAAGGGLH